MDLLMVEALLLVPELELAVDPEDPVLVELVDPEDPVGVGLDTEPDCEDDPRLFEALELGVRRGVES